MDANITVPSLLTPAIITSIKQMKAEQSVKKKKKKKNGHVATKNTSSSPSLVHVDTSNNYREKEAKSKILGSVESQKWCAAKAPRPGKASLAESLMIGWSGILFWFHGRLASHAGVGWSKTA